MMKKALLDNVYIHLVKEIIVSYRFVEPYLVLDRNLLFDEYYSKTRRIVFVYRELYNNIQ